MSGTRHGESPSRHPALRSVLWERSGVRRGFVQIGEALDENAADAGREPGMGGVCGLVSDLQCCDWRRLRIGC